MPKKRPTERDETAAHPEGKRSPADLVPAGYADLLAAIEQRVQTAQVRAAVAVNRELILLYWQIGRDILRRQRQEGWGAKVIDRLATDLHAAFPGMKGFSTRNLKYMRSLADAFPNEAFVQAALARIAWYHAIRFLGDDGP
jgi:predicted nuclease of restriction endonuclease-like (RecB) superfamily